MKYIQPFFLATAFLSVASIVSVVHAQNLGSTSSTVSLLSQTQPEQWMKAVNQRIVTESSTHTAAFLVTSSTSTRGYFLGMYPTVKSVAIATSTIPYAKLNPVPDGIYYVKIVSEPAAATLGSGAGLRMIPTGTGRVSVMSSSTVTVLTPQPHITITSPLSTTVWKKGSTQSVTWIADFKKGTSRNTNYASTIIVPAYGFAAQNGTTSPSHPPGVTHINNSSSSGLPQPPLHGTLPMPPSPGDLPALPSMPLSPPSPTSIFDTITGGIFGDSSSNSVPLAFPVILNIVAYNSDTIGNAAYGTSHLVPGVHYIERGKTPVKLAVPIGHYVLTAKVKLTNTVTHKVETISATSSPFTVN